MEHSARFETVRAHYAAGFWTAAMVKNAVGRWITEAECGLILEEKGENT